MKPSRPIFKGKQKFIKESEANSSSFSTSATGDLIIARGTEDAFIALPKVNVTIGTEFLKTREMDGAVSIAMSDHGGWMKGVVMTRMQDGGPLRLMPLSFENYMRNVVIAPTVAYGFHTEIITDSNDWYIRLIATDQTAGSPYEPFIYVGMDTSIVPEGDLDGDGLIDEEEEERAENPPQPAGPFGQPPAPGSNSGGPIAPLPQTQRQRRSNPATGASSQEVLELVLHRVEDNSGNVIDTNERQLGVTYPETLTFYLRTTQTSEIADEVNYYEDPSMGLIEALAHPPAGPSGRVKQKMWVIENVEVDADGDFSFLFIAETAGLVDSEVTVEISYGEEAIEEEQGGEAGSGGETGGSESGNTGGSGSGETGGEEGETGNEGPLVLITLDSTVDNSDSSEVTGTLTAPSTITFSGTLDETVTSVSSSTGDTVTDNSDGTWTMTKAFSEDGNYGITFYATDGTEIQSVSANISILSDVEAAIIQTPLPAATPTEGTITTNPEDPEALDVVGTSYLVEQVPTIQSPLVTLAIKIKLNTETTVFTFGAEGTVIINATQVLVSGNLFDQRVTVAHEDLNANYLNGEWITLTMVFDKLWSGGYSGSGTYWRSYGAINGVAFEKIIHSKRETTSRPTNLINNTNLRIGPGDFTFKHLEILPDADATPDQISHWHANDGFLYESVNTVPRGLVVEPIYNSNFLDLGETELLTRNSVTEFTGGFFGVSDAFKYLKNGQAFEFTRMAPQYETGKTYAMGFWIDGSVDTHQPQAIIAKRTTGSSSDGWWVSTIRDTTRSNSEGQSYYSFRFQSIPTNSGGASYTTQSIAIGDGYVSLMIKIKRELNDNLEIYVNDFSTPFETASFSKDRLARGETFDYSVDSNGVTLWPFGNHSNNASVSPLTIGGTYGATTLYWFRGAISYVKGFHGITDPVLDSQIYSEIQSSIGTIIIPSVSIDQSGLVNAENITLTGTYSDADSITLNGVQATLNNDGTWSIPTSLTEGMNNLTLIATSSSGIEEQFTTSITLDTITPIIQVTNPVGGFSSDGDTVTVLVGSTWSPTVSSDDGVSQVVESTVYDSSQLGQQTITYTCQDDSGNISLPITVTYVFEAVQVQQLEETAIVDSSSIITDGVLAVSAYSVTYLSNAPKNQAVLQNSHLYNFQEMQTISLWFRYQGATNTTFMLLGDTNNGSIPRLFIRGQYGNAKLNFKWRNTNATEVGNVNGYNDGNWHHIVFSWRLDGKMARTWFDGTLIRDAYTATVRAPAASTQDWNLLSDGEITNTIAFKVMDGLTILNTFADDALVQQLRTYQPSNLDDLFISTENNQSTFNLFQDVNGFTRPNYKIYSNAVEVATADSLGNFSFTLNLSAGQNNFDFVANDGLGGADTNTHSHSVESEAGEWVEEMADYSEENVSTLLQNGVLVSNGTALEPVSTPIGYVLNDVSNQPREFSISMWVKLDPNTPNTVSLLNSDNNKNLFRLHLDGDSLKIGGSTTAYLSNAQVAANVQSAYHFENISTIHGIDLRDNQWHNIIFCFERRDSTHGNFIVSPNELNHRTRATIFVDGILASSHIILRTGSEESAFASAYSLLNPETFTSPFILASTNAEYEIDSVEIKRDVHLTQKQAEWLYDSGVGRGVKKLEAASSQQLEDLNPTGLYDLGDFFFDSPNASSVGSGPTLVANKTYRVTTNNHLRLPVRAETLLIPEYGQNAKTLSFFAKISNQSDFQVIFSNHGGASSGGGSVKHNLWIGVDRTTDPASPAPFIKTSRPYSSAGSGGTQVGTTPITQSLPGGIDFQDDLFHKHTFVFSNGVINYYVDSQHIGELTFQRPLYNSVGVFDWFKGNADIFNVKFQGGTDLSELPVVNEVPIYIYKDGVEMTSNTAFTTVGSNPSFTASSGGLTSNLTSTSTLDTSTTGIGSVTFVDQTTGTTRVISVEVVEAPENALDLSLGTSYGANTTLNGNYEVDVESDGWIDIDHSSDLEITQSSTISAWINPDSILTGPDNRANWFLSKWVPSSNNYGYLIGISKASAGVFSGESTTNGYIRVVANHRTQSNNNNKNFYFNFPSSTPLVAGQWFHITVQFRVSGNVWDVRAFINGELVTSGGNSSRSMAADGWINMVSGIDPDTSAIPLGVGFISAFPGNANTYSGGIANVAIVPSLLTEQELLAQYSAGR
jgi:hypothetical protein